MQYKGPIGETRQRSSPKNSRLIHRARIEAPLRAELFSADQMKQHGRTVALSHAISEKVSPDRLLARLADNEETLTLACRMLTETATASNRITPAGEWLLDNFYLIEEQIRITKRHLPKNYGKSLPKLSNGPMKGFPRVYDIALQIVSHGDGRWDAASTSGFISVYQSVTPLTLGELWAIPIMLRLALIENLRRVAARIAVDRVDRNLADVWADWMCEVAERDPKSLILVIADMARSAPPMTSAYVAELTRRLQGRGVALTLPLTWIEQRLAEDELSTAQFVQTENQQQAANQASVSNSIGSLRRLAEMDWREFVETMSLVERILDGDPRGVYSQMDFGTRDRYRHMVETLARKCKRSEGEVATTAIEAARAVLPSDDGQSNPEVLAPGIERSSHVGFYLVGPGLAHLEDLLGVRRSVFARRMRVGNTWASVGFISAVTLFTLLATLVMLLPAYREHVALRWLGVSAVVAAVACSQLAIGVINWLVTLVVRPRSLPRMDYSSGVPSEARTLVVVPAMLSDASEVEKLIEGLEVRFLGNRDRNLHFALLSDFIDAPTEVMPDDAALVELASRLVTELNDRYPGTGGDNFFLFHRPRRWNKNEGAWIGYERKRGKLAELNAFLRGNGAAAFSTIVGRTDELSNVRYVITLDSDTQLPRDSAREMVAAMAHPLNRPRYDEKKCRVVEGYGILQPRVAEALHEPGLNRLARLNNGDPGLDPYTRTVSDVYQDLFDEGSFIGKGIYDVDAFEQAVGGRFPENRVLSHDLLEGCYARAGLLSDVSLFEHAPGNYLVDARRRMRWIRGDWQLASWLWSRVPARGRTLSNPLSILSQWKLLDNLRRSLVPAALLTLLALGMTVLPHPFHWIVWVAVILTGPAILASFWSLLSKGDDVLVRQHLLASWRTIQSRAAQQFVGFVCLPFEAAYSLSAVIRTCWRVLFSHRKLLQWVPSSQVGKRSPTSPTQWMFAMWTAPAIALLAYVLLIRARPDILPLGILILLLWSVSPLLLWWLSQPYARPVPHFDGEERRLLRTTARRIWAYFEDFVTAEENWLPPDNYQEAPVEAVAHRTSPTNIGLALLANLTAHDFGFIGTPVLLERTASTLSTMATMERYRGHFYNWYDTRTLRPLHPRYVSTVDSGNLAGHLLTLRQGLIELANAPLITSSRLEGIADVLDVLTESIQGPTAPLEPFRRALATIRQSTQWSAPALESLADSAAALMDAPSISSLPLAAHWAVRLAEQCQCLADEVALSDLDLVIAHFGTMPTLGRLAGLSEADLAALGQRAAEIVRQAQERLRIIETLAEETLVLAQMDSSFLYDRASHLMTVGYNVDERQRDLGNYDLLCSEARLGIFVSIAQGQVPQESWFALGRLLTIANGEPILVSWSGSVFEYLMPMLVMPSYRETLLEQTCMAAIHRQITYGRERGVAWGISESGFNAVDTQMNYQYRAFGVPGLGLKRGLADDLVVAPYASLMALMIDPLAAVANLQRLAEEGASGKYGFYEAIDYTTSRLPRGQTHALVRSFMVHHEGMGFLSLSYLLNERPMQRRFVADPLFQATLLLLQERIPKPTASYSDVIQASGTSHANTEPEVSIRSFEGSNVGPPEVQLISNGRYHVMLSQSGGSYRRWRDIALTRWREDGTSDQWGLFGYLRDVESGVFWSTTYQPTAGPAAQLRTVFSEAHVEFSRTDSDIDTQTEIVVSPEDDIELHRVRVRNRGKISRTIEFTSYGEVVLAPQPSDQTHPAFSNLFVETELLLHEHAILATRRPRTEHERPPWMCHLLTVHTLGTYDVSFETDRTRFIGRGRTLAIPRAMTEPGRLSGTSGAVLDPIVSIRCRMVIEPGKSMVLDVVTGITETREHCVALVEKYRDRALANRVFGLAWTHSQVFLRQIDASEAQAQLYSQLAGAIVYPSASHRAEAGTLASNRRGQSGLWGYSISGDLPIILVHIEDAANLELIRNLIRAHSYLRQKGLAVDLVILNEERTGYRQLLQDQVMGLMAQGTVVNSTDRAGGIFVRSTDLMPLEDRVLMQSVAHVVLYDRKGSLAEQLNNVPTGGRTPPRLTKSARLERLPAPVVVRSAAPDLLFYNGTGGFSRDGREYVISIGDGKTTLAPWANVLTNPTFGSVISESGQAYTWVENAHEMRLTPWNNDPVTDSSGEAFYLRDEDTGHFWSPTALPRAGRGPYTTRHGFGYSVFEHVEDSIASELWQYVALDAPIKFVVLKVRNDSTVLRKISGFGYVEWVLGDFRSKHAMHVVTEVGSSAMVCARNRYNAEFGERTAFFDATVSGLGSVTKSFTADRTEFLGRNGSRRNPAALDRTRLSGRVGAGLDPCGAIHLAFELAAGQSREIIFTLGIGVDFEDAERLAVRFRGVAAAREALAATRAYWDHTLSSVQVSTPDPALDLMANGWLIYQTLSSRLWARSGYYQSGGAFGFRDQLQDAMALIHAEPARLREQLILCARHQFLEGDVLHWWHPPIGRGVRSQCSDDYLWLPFAICRYVETTADRSILDLTIPFIVGRPLNPNEESYYDLPAVSHEALSLYQHGVRAIEVGLRFGVHGLPLMGSGDWNDGMNLIGQHGRGESVWLAFFLYTVLERFGALAESCHDVAFAERCRSERVRLSASIEANGWDGQWYRRAYFDDGTPVGSAANEECQIDAIAQSWSVISGAGSKERANTAMQSFDRRLVRRGERLIQLLDPPFDHSAVDPGYIKGYVPGIRENGGQYTHAAIWAAMAFAELGDGDEAWSLFDIINPVNHGRTRAEIAVYRIEPYVAAADVYGVSPHAGRGGWSWYTGSAGWMYRLVLESLLGVYREGERLRIAPSLPGSWTGYEIQYRHGKSLYRIAVKPLSDGESRVSVDGLEAVGDSFAIEDDGAIHEVVVHVPLSKKIARATQQKATAE